MDIRNDAEDLNRSLDDTKEKTRALSDSLKALNTQGFESLTRALSQAGAQKGYRRPAGDIVTDELAKLLKQEIAGGLAALFGSGGKRGGGMPQMLFGAARSEGLSVVIHNNTAAQVSAREVSGSMDRKFLEITIDQMVASSLLRGRQTTGVLSSLFDLAPSLIGR